MPPIEIIKRLDTILLLLINHDSQYRFLDTVMLIARNPVSWIPLYLFMASYFFKKTGKQACPLIVFMLIGVALTDSLSDIFKNIFGRLRPCYDTEIGATVRHPVDCGWQYSFPSAHVGNHFGLAAFWFWPLYKLTGKKWLWLWIWASQIGYSQIYVGEHFPFDIIAGGLLGIIIGTMTARIFSFKWIPNYPFPSWHYPFRPGMFLTGCKADLIGV